MLNVARGGASSRDLSTQVVGTKITDSDVVVLSVGTNDAAPWQQVPVDEFAENLSRFCSSHVPRNWIYLACPGVDERCLNPVGDRTNAIIAP
ncbi:SGNH/GDSL hydrolase family protein [Microlunatus elymi]|uniref:SGNH/GDSL hydrolase family protein n=1 Tax=Microlunatus elymi TaxID=2596828 RepID=A0A516PZ79_9ACTN|nr:SGNH/GDSL hydrolase family protein [Microlunatus elymi]QDP96470.1 SGNH/GDSL hydrolase family protein [Microlunatus elymi]